MAILVLAFLEKKFSWNLDKANKLHKDLLHEAWLTNLERRKLSLEMTLVASSSQEMASHTSSIVVKFLKTVQIPLTII